MSSVSDAISNVQLQIAVAIKQQDAMEQEGQDALSLIQAVAPPPAEAGPPANVAAGVGTQLNVVA